jgi:poly-gamma-glutamate capsule biosynthesis protein CapA/YwtB (metallophosphatase superfamily)
VDLLGEVRGPVLPLIDVYTEYTIRPETFEVPDPSCRVFLVGDLILDEPSPDRFFDRSRSTLAGADLVVGHVEVPHTDRGQEDSHDVPAPPSDPTHLAALARAGFHVATLAGNHIADAGPNGIEDTVSGLRALGIATTGAGRTLDAAREPAIVERAGVRVGVLSYNCVGPRESWATPARPGCAFVRVLTHYELDYAAPGGPPTIYTFADPASLERMQGDIEDLRARVDIVTVALHKGIGHMPATLAMYERPVARAAIDAGADIVVGHHAHILQGIEVYRNKPIFHGLGNFVTVTRALNVEANASPARLAWAKRRTKLFGFEPDPDYPTYPFHPEAKHAVIGWCDVGADGVRKAGFLPCWIHPDGDPEVLGRDGRGPDVAKYVEQISDACRLRTSFRWDGDAVVFLDPQR